MKQKFIALAKEGKYFETNLKANLFLFTEDGNAFGEADRHEAISHAAKLGSQAHVITRSDVENEGVKTTDNMVETEENQASITEDEKEDFEEQINESLLEVVSDATIEIKTTESAEETAGSEIAAPAPNASVAKKNSKPKGK